MKKILICIYNLQGGGAEKVLINLLNSLIYKKCEVSLLVLRKEGIYLNKIPNKIKVIYGFKTLFGRKISNKVLSFFNEKILYKLFLKEKYDVEISFLEGFATKIISGSTNNESKKIAWVHADFSTYHWTNKIFKFEDEKRYYSKFNNIVCVSKLCGKSFEDIFLLKDRVKVIYNLLDKSLESYTKINVNNVFNDYKTTKIIYVGRLEKEKGIYRLIRSFKEVILRGYNITLFILGEGSLKEELKNYIIDNNLGNSVVFISFKENVYDYISSSDYVILPSYSESFSLVLAESVFLNKVCISTDTVGAREVLNNGEYGLIVDNSQEGLTNGIVEVLENHKLVDKYIDSMKNGDYVFNRKVVLEQIFELLELEREG